MPGHDQSRFLTNNEDLDEFTCGLCHEVFINPVITNCSQQMYCSDCINQWLNSSNRCPNCRRSLNKNSLSAAPRQFKNLLAKLMVTCENKDEGCPEAMKISELDKHSTECDYRPNIQCNVCQNRRR